MVTSLNDNDIKGTRGARAIRNAFIELLSEHPYNDITVENIIDRSTYSKSCFYRNYYDKLDVAQQTIREEANLYVQALIDQMKKHSNISDEAMYTYAIAKSTFEYIETKKAFYHMLFQHRFPDMGMEYFCDLAIERFKETVPFNLNSTYTQAEVEFFHYCYTHLFLRYIRFWDSHGFKETTEEMAQLVSALGVMSLPGAVYS